MTHSTDILACGGCTHVPELDQSKLPKIEPLIDLSEHRTTRQLAFEALEAFGLNAKSIAELETDTGVKLTQDVEGKWKSLDTNKTIIPAFGDYILLSQKISEGSVVSENTLYKSLGRTALAYTEEIFGESEGNPVYVNKPEHQSPLMFISASRFVCGYKASISNDELSILKYEGRLNRNK